MESTNSQSQETSQIVEYSESKITRVLIVGVSGYVGSSLAVALKDDFEVFGTYSSHPIRISGVTCLMLDLLNGGEIFEMLKRVQPDVVLFCSGLSNPEECQVRRDMAESLNFKAATRFLKVP